MKRRASMVFFAVGIITVAVLAAPRAATPVPQAGSLDELSWLAGEWQRQTRGGVALERWTLTATGLVGEGLVRRDGEERHTEALLLVAMGGEVFYIARPPENPYPVAFRLVSSEADTFVFENPTHDFPQRIVYRRTAPEAMTAVIEGPGEGGETQRVEFAFVRR